MKKFLLLSSIFLSLVMVTGLVWRNYSNRPIIHRDNAPPAPMPLVQNDPYRHLAIGGIPEEQRSATYNRWLSVGLKIQVNGASGSGTIVCLTDDGWAYVQSCGHLWSGSMSAEQGKTRKLTCKVITWYHNELKLPQPREYPAEVLYYSNPAPNDCSLLKFRPDWRPNFMPIAPANYVFKEGTRFHSVGCDGGREVAHYDVKFIGMARGDLVTTENSPRPGRSGGGLMTDNAYIGICWGTSDKSGAGNGFFTPLATLRSHNERNGYGWVNDAWVNLARQIPIVDRNNPQGQYPPDYIPLPGK